MEVSLPSQLDDFVRAQVRSGRYTDEQEVVRQATLSVRAVLEGREPEGVVVRPPP